MKKRTLATVCLAAVFCLLGLAPCPRLRAEEASDAPGLQTPSTAGALHVEGTHLADASGNPVQLRGISTHGIGWFPAYINDECFRQFRQEWNANVIRLAMYTAESGGYCTDGDKEYLKGLVRDGVTYATQNDMYVIIDWHILSDNNPNMYLEEAKAFFEEMSREYGDYNNVLYEICNEPNGETSWTDIKSYAGEIIPIIRANAPDSVIIVGTPNWSQFVDQAAADPIADYENIMYTLHFYAATHKEDLRSTMTAAIAAGLPVFVTEYGICDASGNGALDLEQANQWISTMNEYGISYVAWNLSNKNESSAILSPACNKTSGFTQEDLSNSGKWLYEMLTGSTPAADVSANNENEPANTPVTSENDRDAATETQTVSESGGMKYTAQVTNSWEADGLTFYQYNLVLENVSGETCQQWEIELSFTDAITLSDGWNGEYQAEGSTLHIRSKDYNGTVEAGAYVTDVGFIISSNPGLGLS